MNPKLKIITKMNNNTEKKKLLFNVFSNYNGALYKKANQ